MLRIREGSVFRIFKHVLVVVAFLSISVLTLFSSSCGKCSCLPDVNVNATSQTGEIVVHLNGIPQPKQGGQNVYTTVSFDGSLVEDKGTNGQSTFHMSRTYEGTPTSVNPSPVITGYALRPGTWQVKVSAGSWSSTGTGGVFVGRTTNFTFTFNTSNVQVN